MNTTTPAIAVVPRTADAWTVEGVFGTTFPDPRQAIQAAARRNIAAKCSTWIYHNGERYRLLRF